MRGNLGFLSYFYPSQASGDVASKPRLAVIWMGFTTGATGAGDGVGLGSGPLCGPPGVGFGVGTGLGAGGL
jgi:hypothetical protein